MPVRSKKMPASSAGHLTNRLYDNIIVYGELFDKLGFSDELLFIVGTGVLDGPSTLSLIKFHVFGPSRTPVPTRINLILN